jgi:CHAT domain-containing protein
MKIFYAGIIEGKTAAEALRAAQGNFAGRGSHPYYWSPFVIIGK